MNEQSLLDQLTSTGIPLTGNTGKVHTLIELARLITETPGLRILDIGCIGPSPLDFWRPLFALYPERFQLTGIDPDAAGIARAQAQFSYAGLTLLPGNGYELTRLFPDQRFDVIVFTQVLEHVYRYHDFLAQVCKPGGHVLFTLDSGHYPRRERLKTTVKDLLARLGREHHFEHGWRDDEIDPVLTQVGFQVVERGYYGVPSSKKFHNQYASVSQKNDLMKYWYGQEEFINRHLTLDEEAKRQFLILFYHAVSISPSPFPR